ALFTVSDADNDVPTKYQFWDSTADPASGHFVVNGAAQAAGGAGGQLVAGGGGGLPKGGTSQSAGGQPANVAIDVTAAQLAQTTSQSGSGSDLLWVRAFDGIDWSLWTSFTVTAPLDSAPTVTAQDPQVVAKNASIAVTSLFSATDPEG